MFYENAFPSKSHESAKFWFEKKSRISRIILQKTPSPVSSDTIAARTPSKKATGSFVRSSLPLTQSEKRI